MKLHQIKEVSIPLIWFNKKCNSNDLLENGIKILKIINCINNYQLSTILKQHSFKIDLILTSMFAFDNSNWTILELFSLTAACNGARLKYYK